MDPTKLGAPGHAIPLTTEWFETQKKMLKQAGIDKTAASEKAHDVYTPSDAAQQLPSTKQEKFLESVKPQIMELDPNSEGFVPEATRKLVDGVISQEYGEHMTRSPAYPMMQDKITRTILEDPHHRESVEEFLDLLLMSGRPAGSGEGPATPAPGPGTPE